MSHLLLKRLPGLVLLFTVIGMPFAQADGNPAILSLGEAEQLALQADPMLARSDALAQAFEEAAVADGQLPDPQARVSLLNFPADTFRTDQEPITQLRFGVTQAFPAGDTLEYKSERTRAMAGKARAANADARLKILREVRRSWLDRFYWLEAGRIVQSNKELFSQLVDITTAQYAAGRRNQQDVLRAELELGLLDDRLTEIQQQAEVAQAALAKWIGGEAGRDMPAELPVLPAPPGYEQLRDALGEHPVIRQSAAEIEATQQDMHIAREAYKPNWAFGVEYGIRDGENADGSPRADFVTATVSFDVPLFTENRQDRRLAAARQQANASRNARDDEYRELKRQLDDEFAKWTRFAERLTRFEQMLVIQARENTEATYNAYQADTTDFATLMRANITELNTRLQALRLRVDHAKSQAQLLYLAGDNS